MLIQFKKKIIDNEREFIQRVVINKSRTRYCAIAIIVPFIIIFSTLSFTVSKCG